MYMKPVYIVRVLVLCISRRGFADRATGKENGKQN